MNRVAFTLFGIDVMWYGVIIAVGMLIGIFFALRECRRIGFQENDVIDILLIAIPIGVVCARLYYCIFEWSRYAANPIEVLYIRDGGLAIHGGIIGGVVTAIVACIVKKINFWQLSDILSPSIILAQAIGRWGNFVNQEAYGGPTDLPWGIMINGVKVHPTFLYESIGNFLIFLFLMWYRKNKKKVDGEVFALYLILYSILRFFVEGLRTDSLMFLGLKQAQLFSIFLVIIGIFIIIFQRKRVKI